MNLFKAIGPALDLFRAGHELKQATAWTQAGLVGTALAAAVCLVEALWQPLGISADQQTLIAAGIAALAKGVLDVISDRRIGLPVKPKESAHAQSVASPVGPRGSAYGYPVARRMPESEPAVPAPELKPEARSNPFADLQRFE